METSQYKVLVPKHLESDLKDLNSNIVFFEENLVDFKIKISNKDIAVVCIDTSRDIIEIKNLIKSKESLHKDCGCIFLYKSMTMDKLCQLATITSNSCFIKLSNTSVVTKTINKKLLKFARLNAIKADYYSLHISVKKKKEEYSHIKKLYLQTSENLSLLKADHQSRKTQKQFIKKFIFQISENLNLEDLLKVFVKELRRWINFKNIFLIVSVSKDEKKLYYLSREQLKSFYINDLKEGLRISLANKLERPVLSLIPLPLNSIDNLMEIILECDSEEVIESKFYEIWSDIKDSVSLVTHHIYSFSLMNQLADIWRYTFYSISSPIAVFSIKEGVLQSNESFNLYYSSELIDQILDKIKSRSMNFKVETHKSLSISVAPIALGESKVEHYFVQLFDDSKTLSEQSLQIQNEKLSALGLLAGNIAHELSNPLSGLKMASETLLDDFRFNEIHSDVNEIQNGVLRCLAVIKSLSTFSEKEAPSDEIVNINDLIGNTIPLLKSLMRSYSLKINVIGEIFVRGKYQLLQQVLFNLINNACHSMGGKSGDIKINAESKDKKVFIDIEDEGGGISSEIITKIFEPFFTTKEESVGTGLGLSLCRDIIERHGGKISVKSVINKGSTFTVELPLYEK